MFRRHGERKSAKPKVKVLTAASTARLTGPHLFRTDEGREDPAMLNLCRQSFAMLILLCCAAMPALAKEAKG